MAWKQGPLPTDTYGWGGVVPFDWKSSGFFFADFMGDRVAIFDNSAPFEGRVLLSHEVLWYNNCLDLPPTGAKSREG